MMNALVSVDLFLGYKVGRTDNVYFSRLQFVDGTLLVGNKNWTNIISLKALLLLFEASSGLKVNFHKSILVGVNVTTSWLNEVASVLNCKIGHVPFFYICLPIEGDSHKLNFWKHLVEMVKSRLGRWKSRNLSLGGRLVLLKSILSSLSVFFLSFFKAPAGIIISLESIFNFFFFLDGGKDFQKITWINWDTICLKKEEGGMGVRRIREFNLSLLSKWCWRLRVKKGTLWYKVLAARYGDHVGECRQWEGD